MNKLSKIYFASDTHFGTPNTKESFTREQKFIRWLDFIKKDATELYLVGDIFDFWFDYDTVIPKGFTRLFGKLAELTDANIPIHFFKGNHDMWLHHYFETELGFIIHSNEYEIERNGIKIYIHHGDGKGPKDYKYKMLKKIFRNSFFTWCFKWIHPDLGMRLALYSSKNSRYKTGEAKKETFQGIDNEWLAQYALKKNTELPRDYFIFGHRHLPLQLKLNENCHYINLGDWLHYSSYAVLENQTIQLFYFDEK